MRRVKKSLDCVISEASEGLVAWFSPGRYRILAARRESEGGLRAGTKACAGEAAQNVETHVLWFTQAFRPGLAKCRADGAGLEGELRRRIGIWLRCVSSATGPIEAMRRKAKKPHTSKIEGLRRPKIRLLVQRELQRTMPKACVTRQSKCGSTFPGICIIFDFSREICSNFGNDATSNPEGTSESGSQIRRNLQ